MHIKQVLVEGFKSYKDQTRTEPFSNKLNTIVGANGSGKSNFFQAVRFVLDLETATLRPEERQKLLHEGAGHAVLSAFVEVVLDNSDGRIQGEKEEVRLRRTIGKKDEYQLNKKRIKKTELSELLESAGFSKANPYYVVQQGKIMALSMMRDEERLDLLKEIGGSKVYEDRRTESLKVIQDADGRTQQIAELVTEMEAKLKQLDAEREELAKYQAIDRECRSLEYAIHDKEVSDAGSKLEEIERQRQEEAERAGRALDEREAAHTAMKQAEKGLKQATAEQEREQAKLAEIGGRRSEALARKTQVDLDVAELLDSKTAGAASRAQCQKEMKSLEKEVAQAEKKLRAAEKAFREREAGTQELTGRLKQAQTRQEALDTKQGHSQNFATLEERDDHIKKEVKLKEDSQRKLRQQIKALQDSIAGIEQSRQTLIQGLADKRGQISEIQQRCTGYATRKQALEEQRNEAHNERQNTRRRDNDLTKRRKELQESVRKLELKMDPQNSWQQKALAAARRLSKTYNVPLHGTILELIEPIPQLTLATEVAAGGSLFHMVVDTDEQASALLRLLQEENSGGRITCLPLNKLHFEAVQYPTQFGDLALPLTKYLKYPEQVRKAVEMVFGRWMICRDSDVASKVIACTQSIDCVTISGDTHSRKGTLTGGHRDEKRGKLQAHKQKVAEETEIESIRKEQEELEQICSQREEEVNGFLNEIEQLILAQKDDSARLQDLEAAVQADTEELRGLEALADSKRRAIADDEELLKLAAESIKVLRGELGSKELGKLSKAEVQEKQRLAQVIAELQTEISQAQNALEAARVHLAEVQSSLDDNLLKRKAELDAKLSSLDRIESSHEVNAKQREAAKVEAEMFGLEQEERDAQGVVDALQQRCQDLKAEAERLRDLQKATEADDEANAMAQLLAKRSTLLQKKADHEKKIRELGSLPAEAFEKFQGKSLAEVNRLLAKAQKQLKKYGHVNKKALDQYVNFTEQKEELVRRHDETVRGKEKIQQLIRNLDLRKDEAIERTFKGVAKNFREIFAELAPGGKGELVMQKASPQEQAPESEDAAAHPSANRYSAVKVKVSFGSGETMTLKQLSGGQKTLVALALIFSIQRLDPAPFYLFDEIDAALDPAYRATVAKMLAKQANDPSNPSQFIITTFHPQIVHESDQVYGVSHSARISTIDAITKEDALDFLSTDDRTAAVED